MPSTPRLFVPRNRLQHGIEELSLSGAAALTISRLPGVHREPFDRMLVAQALCDDLTLVTPDELLHGYPARIEW